MSARDLASALEMTTAYLEAIRRTRAEPCPESPWKEEQQAALADLDRVIRVGRSVLRAWRSGR